MQSGTTNTGTTNAPAAGRRQLLIAEELLLLLLNDRTGRVLVDSTRIKNGLAGALLIELALEARVAVADGTRGGPGAGAVRRGRLVVLDDVSPADPELADALQTLLRYQGRKPKDALGRLGKGLKERLLDRLAAEGLLRAEHARVLGLFPTTRWPSTDDGSEAAVVGRVRNVLVSGRDPDARTAALVSLLSALDAAGKVLPDADRRQVKARARQVAAGSWASDAVRRAVADVEAAVTAAVIVSTTAGAVSS